MSPPTKSERVGATLLRKLLQYALSVHAEERCITCFGQKCTTVNERCVCIKRKLVDKLFCTVLYTADVRHLKVNFELNRKQKNSNNIRDHFSRLEWQCKLVIHFGSIFFFYMLFSLARLIPLLYPIEMCANWKREKMEIGSVAHCKKVKKKQQEFECLGGKAITILVNPRWKGTLSKLARPQCFSKWMKERRAKKKKCETEKSTSFPKRTQKLHLDVYIFLFKFSPWKWMTFVAFTVFSEKHFFKRLYKTSRQAA